MKRLTFYDYKNLCTHFEIVECWDVMYIMFIWVINERF